MRKVRKTRRAKVQTKNPITRKESGPFRGNAWNGKDSHQCDFIGEPGSTKIFCLGLMVSKQFKVSVIVLGHLHSFRVYVIFANAVCVFNDIL